jgi:type VI secretion system protein
MPGTGNREEPLSPAPTGEGRDTAGPPPVSLPTAPAAVAGSGGANPLIAALAEGLGLDRAVLEGLDPRTTAATAGRAVRAAANGVAEAIDARNALARVAGVDPRSLDHDDGNPFATFRSGEEAMKHALVGTSGVQSLDAATRSSVAALAVNSNAAAAGLDAVLARFSTDPPPRSAAEVREIFGTAFLNAYHRETDRLK